MYHIRYEYSVLLMVAIESANHFQRVVYESTSMYHIKCEYSILSMVGKESSNNF